ncbi:hypothetical protein AB8Z38_13485 [Bradyrhizobium sp. LLZ17]|uniref:Lytic murein transglycosylase n=1 Tax=Bradyrhizobium sp. LLZ17 TaxID=3239388 RepID=A0AB39XS24_9BRAD
MPDTVKAPLPLPWQFVLVPVNVHVPSKPPPPAAPPAERRAACGAGAALDLEGFAARSGSAGLLSRAPDRDFSSLPMLPPALPD